MEFERDCEVCGADKPRVISRYTRSRWPVVECTCCHFVYLKQAPVYDALNDEFAWEKSHAAEAEKRSKKPWAKLDRATRWRLLFGKLLDNRSRSKAQGRVLEVGCGGNTRVPAGAVPFGIEISEGLAAVAAPVFEARGGRCVHAPALTGIQQFASSFFDAIVMRSYLEHEAHPYVVLLSAAAKLKPGGRIYVRVPNFASPNRYVMGAEWCGFRFPDHVNYFTPRTLKALATRAGLKYRRVNWYSPFDDNITAEFIKPLEPTYTVAAIATVAS
jgi:SAM-dependent methyltransferase